MSSAERWVNPLRVHLTVGGYLWAIGGFLTGRTRHSAKYRRVYISILPVYISICAKSNQLPMITHHLSNGLLSAPKVATSYRRRVGEDEQQHLESFPEADFVAALRHGATP